MAKKATSKTTGAGTKRRGSAKVEKLRPEETAQAAAGLTHEQIAQRAREIWEREGRPQGQDEKNWRQAEEELKREMGKK
jgi:hypothetical protein